ncbi:MAG: hypothetical protein U0931_19915 [Vulcanimicrobiota bacterium]
MVERLEMQLAEVMESFRRAHPGLQVRLWSHSVARLTLDGWSLGFEILGLRYPIEFGLCFSRAHSTPIARRAQAGWIVPQDDDFKWEIINLLSCAGLETFVKEPPDPDAEDIIVSIARHSRRRPIPAQEVLAKAGNQLLRALARAVREGPQERSLITGTIETDEAEPEPVPLTRLEESVVRAWVEHLRAQGFSPVEFSSVSQSINFHLASPGQARRVALKLDARIPAREALVQTLLGAPWASPGNSLASYDWRAWREHYRKHPCASGWMGLHRPGIAEDQASLLFSAFVGLWDEEPSDFEETDRPGSGLHLVTLERRVKDWRVTRLQRLPYFWSDMTSLEVALQIHFDGKLETLERDRKKLHLRYQGIEFHLLADQLFHDDAPPFRCSGPCAVVDPRQPEQAIVAINKILEARGAG